MTTMQRDFLRAAGANSSPPPEYTPSQIYEDFCAWCEDNGLDSWKMNSFTKPWSTRADDRGCIKGRKSSLGRYWTGFDFATGRANVPGQARDDDEGIDFGRNG